MDFNPGWRTTVFNRSAQADTAPLSIAGLALTALIVFVTAYAAIILTNHTERVAVIWVANALLLWRVVRAPRAHWPVYFIVGYVANVAADFATGDPLVFASLLSL